MRVTLRDVQSKCRFISRYRRHLRQCDSINSRATDREPCRLNVATIDDDFDSTADRWRRAIIEKLEKSGDAGSLLKDSNLLIRRRN